MADSPEVIAERLKNFMDLQHEQMTALQQLMERRFMEIASTLEEIKEQTKKTNGRVTKLELWRSMILGGSGVIIFIFGYLFQWIIRKVT
jgi:hypothetical protein